MGEGGEHGGPDPTSGHTGNYVYGYNLYGDYPNNLGQRQLTTTPIDCTDMTHVRLGFWRWLGVEHPDYDNAMIKVSPTGSDWIVVWINPTEITDTGWVYQELDISEYADDQPTVYIRWTMGPTDGGWTYCGWNIDDIHILGFKFTLDGDVNGDDKVDLVDLAIILMNYGLTGEDLEGDLDADGDVDLNDLAVVLANYGRVRW
jgi:hypothetical protein